MGWEFNVWCFYNGLGLTLKRIQIHQKIGALTKHSVFGKKRRRMRRKRMLGFAIQHGLNKVVFCFAFVVAK